VLHVSVHCGATKRINCVQAEALARECFECDIGQLRAPRHVDISELCTYVGNRVVGRTVAAAQEYRLQLSAECSQEHHVVDAVAVAHVELAKERAAVQEPNARDIRAVGNVQLDQVRQRRQAREMGRASKRQMRDQRPSPDDGDVGVTHTDERERLQKWAGVDDMPQHRRTYPRR